MLLRERNVVISKEMQDKLWNLRSLPQILGLQKNYCCCCS